MTEVNIHISSSIATYSRNGEILISRSLPVQRTVNNLKENAEIVRSITNGKRTKVLVFLCNSPVPDKIARKLSAELVPQLYSAMALVSKPGLAQLVMKMVFAFQNPAIPVKIFTDSETAIIWLRKQK